MIDIHSKNIKERYVADLMTSTLQLLIFKGQMV